MTGGGGRGGIRSQLGRPGEVRGYRVRGGPLSKAMEWLVQGWSHMPVLMPGQTNIALLGSHARVTDVSRLLHDPLHMALCRTAHNRNERHGA